MYFSFHSSFRISSWLISTLLTFPAAISLSRASLARLSTGRKDESLRRRPESFKRRIGGLIEVWRCGIETGPSVIDCVSLSSLSDSSSSSPDGEEETGEDESSDDEESKLESQSPSLAEWTE